MKRAVFTPLELRFARGRSGKTMAWVVLGWLVILGCLTAAHSAISDPSPDTFYWWTSLGTLPGYSDVRPIALNDAGQALCQARTIGLPRRSFLSIGDSRIDLGTLSGGETLGYGLDDSGRVVGAALLPGGSRVPFLWEQGAFTVLAVPSGYVGAEARAIAEDGRIAGDLIDAGGGHHACSWTRGEVELLPTLAGRPFSQARAINNAGEIAGATFAVYDPAASGHAGQGRAALWRANEVIDLGVLPGFSASEASALSDRGQVVGTCTEQPGFQSGFSWRQGELLPVGRQNTTCWAVNNAGFIVGEAVVYRALAGYRYGAAGWRDPAYYGDILDESVAPKYGAGRFDTAVAINEAGQVLVDGWYGAQLLTSVHADLRITASADRLQPKVGEQVVLKATVRNLGPDPAYNVEFNYYAPPGLEITAQAASFGEFDFYMGRAYGSIEALPAGATVEVAIHLVVHSAGEIQTGPGIRCPNDADPTDNSARVTLIVAGTPLPDLAPRRLSAHLWGRSSRPAAERWILGSVDVRNFGTAEARNVVVCFYLVTSGSQWSRSILLQRVKVGTVKTDSSVTARLNARQPLAVHLENTRVLAVIDPDDRVPESLETNNSALSAPL